MSVAALQPINKLAKVLIVDDHSVLLDALTFVLASKYEIACISSLSEIDAQILAFQPDLVVIDIAMPDGDGVTACQRLVRQHPKLKCMFLSMHTGAERRRAIGAGAHGYVSKRASAGELMRAIETVLDGGEYHAEGDPAVAAVDHPSESALTERQVQVLRLVAHGASAKEIANELNISVRTAEFHRGAIMQRLGIHSTALLTRYAVDKGLL